MLIQHLRLSAPLRVVGCLDVLLLLVLLFYNATPFSTQRVRSFPFSFVFTCTDTFWKVLNSLFFLIVFETASLSFPSLLHQLLVRYKKNSPK